MRLDKFLKVSRIIKRRSVAKDFCDANRSKVNGRAAKPGTDIKVGDILELKFGPSYIKVKVLDINEKRGKSEASSMYETLEEINKDEL